MLIQRLKVSLVFIIFRVYKVSLVFIILRLLIQKFLLFSSFWNALAIVHCKVLIITKFLLFNSLEWPTVHYKIVYPRFLLFLFIIRMLIQSFSLLFSSFWNGLLFIIRMLVQSFSLLFSSFWNGLLFIIRMLVQSF